MQQFSLRHRLCGFGAAVALAFGTGLQAQEGSVPLSTTEPSVPAAISLEDLSARIQALEHQNQILLQQLQQGQFRPTATEYYDPGAAASAPAVPGAHWKASWKNALEFEAEDGMFKMHIGGRTQLDAIWLDAESGALAGSGGVGDADSVNFRRARFLMEGTIYETIDFAAEYDFVNSTNDNVGLQPATENNVTHLPAPTDLWFTFKELPWVGNLRVGNMKEPIGFEHVTSSRHLDFLERSFAQDLFTGPFNNGFTPGVMLFNSYGDNSGMWFLGAFKNTQNVFAFDTGDGEYAVTGRVTFLPWFDAEQHQLLHFGFAASVRDNDQDRIRFRTRGSLRNGPGALNPVFADTGFFTADDQTILGAEAAWQCGRLRIQGEWLGSWVDDSAPLAGTAGVPSGNMFVNCYHAEVLYFLTDDASTYEFKRGAYSRMTPQCNFRWKGGCFDPGAWELAFRYAAADLNDDGLMGGRVEDYTVGLNWFLNPNMKIQFNYVVAVRNNALAGVEDGTINGFGMRLAHDF